MNISLSSITDFVDGLLDIRNVADWPNALNGLQLANGGQVTKIGAAVDAGEPTVKKAVAEGVDLLLVHHGMYWAGLQPITAALYRKTATAMRENMAIYSSHLPLDVHPSLGNNALLAKALGMVDTQPFFFEKGQYLGLKAATSQPLDELVALVEAAVGGAAKVFRGGPKTVSLVGVVTGGAGAEIYKAAGEGIDTFVTGEGPHWAAIVAEEVGVNLILGGHYATETFGVKALAAHVAEEFGLPSVFIDHPTGL